MASIYVLPNPVGLSSADMLVGINTDNYNLVYAKADFTFSNAAIPANATFTIGWSQGEEVFVFKASPIASSALEIQIPTTLNAAYADYIAEKLRSNDRISNTFDVTAVVQGSSIKVSLTAWNTDPLSITALQSQVPGLTISKTDSTGPFTKENLTALLTVNDATTNQELLRLTQPYQIDPESATLKAKSLFDIKAAFALKPFIVTDLATPFGLAEGSFDSYYVRYADRYGSPPLAEALQKSVMKHVVYGTDIEGFQANTQDYYLLHKTASTTITKTQAAWMYFLKYGTSSELLDISVRVYFQNGTPFDFYLITPREVEPNKVYFLRTDYAFLGIDAACAAVQLDPANITGYDVSLKAGITERVKRRYTLKTYQGCKTATLAYTNGYGGVETVTMHNRSLRRVEAERTAYQIEGANIEGKLFEEARKIWEFKTELISESEAEKLAQLIMGDVWLLDQSLNTITPIIADTKTVEIKPLRGMAQLTVVFKSAKIYQAL